MNSYPYTLSLHRCIEGSHIDFFIDVDISSDMLLHYKTNVLPISLDTFFCVFIGTPHRRLYLSYSGPISNNRGRIRVIKHGFLYSQETLSFNSFKNSLIIYFVNNRVQLVCGKK